MTEIRQDNLAELLIALADGELDAEAALNVWTYLADHPQALKWIQTQQKIAAAVRGSIHAPTPVELRSKIETMVRREAILPETLRRSETPWLRLAGALAAGLLLGVLLAPPLSPRKPTQSQHALPVLPISTIVEAGRIHADCSRLAEVLHSASFEKVDATLATEVTADFKSDHPDLASIGFHYVGAGPCLPLMKQTVHLLYHSNRPGSLSAISIFVQPNQNQFAMEPSRVYAVSSESSPFPMVAWESERVVYFLVTDNDATQAAAMDLLRPTATHPVTPSPKN